MAGCALCERDVETTTHHLTPKNRTESDTVEFCGACHRQVHAVFTNHELRHRYDSLEALRESEEVQKFVRWVRTHDPDHVEVDDSEDVRRWRS